MRRTLSLLFAVFAAGIEAHAQTSASDEAPVDRSDEARRAAEHAGEMQPLQRSGPSTAAAASQTPPIPEVPPPTPVKKAAAAAPRPATDSRVPEAPAGFKASAVTVEPSGQPGSATTSDEVFDTRVRGLEEQVVDLKERIYRSRARLLLLQEAVLGGDLVSGARAVLTHRNEMGNAYALDAIAYALDGAPIFTKTDGDGGELAKREELEVFNGRIVPGPHQLSVRVVYKTRGERVTVNSSYTFNAEAARITAVRIVGYEKGGLTSDPRERPAVRYDVEVGKDAAAKQLSLKAGQRE